MLVAAVLAPSGALSLPAAFPLKASGRVLVDQAGSPFRIQGDAGWSLMANLSLGEADEYLADWQARGFNAVVVNLIEHKYAAHAPANREGEFPFLAHQAGRYDFSTVNPAYFEHVDWVLARARDRGMLVLLVPMYLGFGGGEEGWWTELTNGTNTKDVCRRYGEWVGKRYRGFENVIWVAGGDYTPPEASEGRARLRAIVDGIRSVSDQAWTGHWSPESHAFAGPAFGAPLDLDAVYTYGPKNGTTGWTYLLSREAFAQAGDHPTFLIETRYEGKGVSREFVRRAMWWGVLSSSSGAVFGNEAVWSFPSRWGFWRPWQRSLASPGTTDFRCLGALLDRASAARTWSRRGSRGPTGSLFRARESLSRRTPTLRRQRPRTGKRCWSTYLPPEGSRSPSPSI